MKTFIVIQISVLCFSFCPSIEKVETNTCSGFYISVKDLTDHTYHKYIIEAKDSANLIFKKYFEYELELGEVDYPISIFNGKRDFYIARVNIFVKPNGEKNFKHLKYPSVYNKNSKLNKRQKLNPTIF